MNIKFARALLLLAGLRGPVGAYADDTSTDTAGQYLDDATITTKVKAAFAEDKWAKGRDISVRTDHGVVDLTGMVNSKDESDRATETDSALKMLAGTNIQLPTNATNPKTGTPKNVAVQPKC